MTPTPDEVKADTMPPVTPELLDALQLYVECDISDISATRPSESACTDIDVDCSDEVMDAINLIVQFAAEASRAILNRKPSPATAAEGTVDNE